MDISKKISVLIGTCDKYEPIWKNFQICFNKTWVHETNNIFVTESKTVPQYTNTKFASIQSSKSTWALRMLDGLSACNTDYIFFILDDYLFTYSYSKQDLLDYLSFMEAYSINRLQISPSGFQSYKSIHGIDKKYLQIPNYSLYGISLQPSIWRKDYILKMLLPEYSPWDFEIKGSNSINLDDKNHNIFIDSSLQNVYFNAIRKGFVKTEGWDLFRSLNGLEDF